ncbi:RHS repeat-associated core domain-containing protein [Clostridium sp. VAP51]|uniref:RHS repeat-associated core domain-containing protein n=1 Tax=Clostridium sp. VAP51 TaxID=2949978 RepID=UPI00207A0965|nr:RHS repeat-associated core domain-containing protein [Clostridium sp. VAP51]
MSRYYYSVDEQGSTDFITDDSENIKNEYYYDAFGNVLDSKEEIHNRITYTGQQFDGITQQYYLRARFYNPVVGRFTQEDVYRGDGLNLYAYCGNNPVRYYDPSGYQRECPPSKIQQSSSRVEIIDTESGTFKIIDWSEYPDEYVPMPNQDKTWTFLQGGDYDEARKSANKFNSNLRRSDTYYKDNKLEIHEVEPVKFGGSPTDVNNKTTIQSKAHRKYVTPWWNKIRDEVKKGLSD